MAGHVFISYSREDRAYARELADDLRRCGFEPWIDDRIDYGDRWWRTVVRAIHDCACFVVVMTPDSDESEWVEREVHVALRREKPLFPLLLRGEEFALLITRQYTDVTSGQMPPQDFYERLGRVVFPEPATVEADRATGADALFRCPECGLPFKRESDLAEHLANWHQDAPPKRARWQTAAPDSLTCPECGLPFKRASDLAEHTANWHPTAVGATVSRAVRPSITAQQRQPGDTAERFKAVLADLSGYEAATISPRAHLMWDLELDELDIIELTLAVEDEWGLSIPDEALGDVSSGAEGLRLKTVQDWVAYLER
jgi:acyl carrier protein